jgi:hypothetical protein
VPIELAGLAVDDRFVAIPRGVLGSHGGFALRAFRRNKMDSKARPAPVPIKHGMSAAETALN